MKKKSIAVVLALVLLVCCAVGGVLAWLTATSGPVVNTFTVGNVDITLAESENLNLKMVPGQTITKDPKVTVVGGSEACWLFVKVEKSDNLDSYIEYTVDSAVWTALPGENGVYYREVSAEVAKAGVEYNVLGAGNATYSNVVYSWNANQVLVKPSVTKGMMDGLTDNTRPTLTFTAYACQMAGFEGNAAGAWAAASAKAA